ncbi:hypothetical protein [Novosphingobium sp. MMS21-SN21R]|uniref:hypothetical protein n=1 Tax=Novosphingobium sp. MMS21-SN21R TaxID=2969298 RepID=UPI002886548A|nr:hypothetical protein [Novosphingobium sp. MMS21-SN21R]MDT0507556.1 hypothetical protein [Novosphingobium sp. MMS21-SN21R]MDT0509509.1 hypothetical protein [Novosphingobium sp. MMS21-SN21R]
MTTKIDTSSEEVRTYVYGDGAEYSVPDPMTVFVLESGSHRVVDRDGWVHRPEKGWIAIKWKPLNGQPAFVA